MKSFNFLLIGLIALFFVTALYFGPMLPDKLASHWNSSGEVDGYSSKVVGLYLIPFISLIILGLYFVVPLLDPLKKNYESFMSYYNSFFLVLLLFFYYIFLMTILYNLDYEFNFTYILIPAISILFYFVGLLVEHSKRNYFVGIRTPWTLQSDELWEDTSKKSGFLFKVSSILCLTGLFFPMQAIWFILTPIFLTLAFTLICSYITYKKIQ